MRGDRLYRLCPGTFWPGVYFFSVGTVLAGCLRSLKNPSELDLDFPWRLTWQAIPESDH